MFEMFEKCPENCQNCSNIIFIVKPRPQTLSPKTPKPKKTKPRDLGLTLKFHGQPPNPLNHSLGLTLSTPGLVY